MENWTFIKQQNTKKQEIVTLLYGGFPAFDTLNIYPDDYFQKICDALNNYEKVKEENERLKADAETRWYCVNCYAPLILKKNCVVKDETELRCFKCSKLNQQLEALQAENEKLKHYYGIVDTEMENITGWKTIAENMAYDKGRQHEQTSIKRFVTDWKIGESNSVFGTILQTKFEALQASHAKLYESLKYTMSRIADSDCKNLLGHIEIKNALEEIVEEAKKLIKP